MFLSGLTKGLKPVGTQPTSLSTIFRGSRSIGMSLTSLSPIISNVGHTRHLNMQPMPSSIKSPWHIGIVGVTTVGACSCAKRIVAKAASIDKEGRHPEFTIHTLPFNKYKEAADKEDWDSFSKSILRSIRALEQAGSEFVIIPSNTPHVRIHEIQEKSPLPVLSMLDIVVDQCKKQRLKRVAVLGTQYIMESRLYDEVLEKAGISTIVPNKGLRERIHALIMDEIIPDKINQTSVNRVIKQLKLLKEDCDAMILACTELPEVLNKDNLNCSVIDTTDAMAKAALQLAVTKDMYTLNSMDKRLISFGM